MLLACMPLKHISSPQIPIQIQGMIYNFAQHKFEFYVFVQIAAIVQITFFFITVFYTISKSQHYWNFRLVKCLFWGCYPVCHWVSKYAYFLPTEFQVYNFSLFGDKSKCLLALLTVPWGTNSPMIRRVFDDEWNLSHHNSSYRKFNRYSVILCDLFLRTYSIQRITKLIYIILLSKVLIDMEIEVVKFPIAFKQSDRQGPFILWIEHCQLFSVEYQCS